MISTPTQTGLDTTYQPSMTPQPVMTSDDILGEIDRAHAGLSDPTKQAIAQSGIGAGLDTAPGAPPTLADGGIKTPPMGGLAPTSTATADMGISPRMTTTGTGLVTPTANRSGTASTPTPGTVAPESESQRLARTGSGISQIKSPFARVPLQILDALGRGLVPGIEMGLPGTSGHHDVLVSQAQNAEKLASEEAKTAAEAGAENAAADLATAQAEDIRHPGEYKQSEIEQRKAQAERDIAEAKKAGRVHGDFVYDKSTDKIIGYQDENGKFMSTDNPELPEDVKKIMSASTAKTLPFQHAVMPDGSVVAMHQDPQTGKVTAESVYQGDPKAETEVIKREVGGKPHNVLIDKKSGKDITDLGELGEKPPVVNVNTAQRPGKTLLDKAEATYRTAAQSADDLVDFIDQAKAGNKVAAQASPLEGTLAIVTSQGVKRINRTEVEGIEGAGNLFDKIMGEVGKIVAGQPLPPNIQKDFQSLAQTLKKNAYKTYRGAYDSAVKRYHLEDEQPLPEPKESVSVDPTVKAFADKYFGGDVSKAQAEIENQKKKKK